MKDYEHTWQWGDNPEYTVSVCTHWNRWALPLIISWWSNDNALNSKCYAIDIEFLCFILSIEIWRWKK